MCNSSGLDIWLINVKGIKDIKTTTIELHSGKEELIPLYVSLWISVRQHKENSSTV